VLHKNRINILHKITQEWKTFYMISVVRTFKFLWDIHNYLIVRIDCYILCDNV